MGGRALRIIADTNLLVRAAVLDDEDQARLATHAMANAELVAVPIASLCEFVWVLRRSYRRPSAAIADSIRRLIDGPNIITDRIAVEAGLAILDSGGDFADGVIAFQGQMLGAQTFVSFDKEAVRLLVAQGERAEVLN